MIAHRPGALERVGSRWTTAPDAPPPGRHRDPDHRDLDDLQLTELVTSITGLSPVGAAAILAETGDPRRFATGRALVKHAGLAPAGEISGNFTGRTNSPAGAPAGLAAGGPSGGARVRARFALPAGPLTSRQQTGSPPPRPRPHRRAILRRLHAVITTGQRWDPVIATHGTRPLTMTPIAA